MIHQLKDSCVRTIGMALVALRFFVIVAKMISLTMSAVIDGDGLSPAVRCERSPNDSTKSTYDNMAKVLLLMCNRSSLRGLESMERQRSQTASQIL